MIRDPNGSTQHKSAREKGQETILGNIRLRTASIRTVNGDFLSIKRS